MLRACLLDLLDVFQRVDGETQMAGPDFVRWKTLGDSTDQYRGAWSNRLVGQRIQFDLWLWCLDQAIEAGKTWRLEIYDEIWHYEIDNFNFYRSYYIYNILGVSKNDVGMDAPTIPFFVNDDQPIRWYMMTHDDSLFLNEPCLILVLLRGERFIHRFSSLVPCQSPWYWLDLTWLLLMEKPLEIQHLLQKWLLEHLPPWKLAAMPFLQHLQINQTWKNEIPSTIFKDGHLYAKIIYKIGKCPAKK